jgi:sterol desaturase/sphingolipid hydroxylase (fatty acid hydroxylase superfamily)
MLFFISALISIPAVVVALEVERICGAPQAKNVSLNAICGFFHLAITQLFSASIAPGVIWLGGKISKTPVHLSDRGWMLPVSVFLILALMDLFEYTFHRLEQKIPWL